PLREFAPGSALFVCIDVAVDEAGNVVLLPFLLLEEGVVRLVGVFDLDVLVDRDRIDLVLSLLDLGERDRLGLIFLALRLLFGRTRGPRQRCRMEHRAAFGADNGVSVEVVEFRRAGLALPLGAEIGFGHGVAILQEIAGLRTRARRRRTRRALGLVCRG